MLDQKNQEINDLQYELARVCKVTCLLYYIYMEKNTVCELVNGHETAINSVDNQL